MIPNLTLEMAILLDRILTSEITHNYRVTLSWPEKRDFNDYITAGNILKSYGYGMHYKFATFQITPLGKTFIKGNSFVNLYNEELEKDRHEKQKHKLTDKQIANLKWQPFLIAWSIVSTLSTIILAYLNFKK